MTDFARYHPHADGVTDDSAAFLHAFSDMQALSAAGVPAFLDIPTARYRISFTRSNTVQVDPLDPNYAPHWSFYNFDSAQWGPCAPPADIHSPTLRPIKIRGNGSILLVDGNPGSYFLSSTIHNDGLWRIDLEDLVLRPYDPTRVAHCFGFQNLCYSRWSGVKVEDFAKGIGLYLSNQSERNAFTSCDFVGNQRGLVLGANQAVDFDVSQSANENRFYGCNFVMNGMTLPAAECLKVGFIEINNGSFVMFSGGSWKMNRNPLIVRLCFGGRFDGVYFEDNGYALGADGKWAANSPIGYRNHLILDAASCLITGALAKLPIRELTFASCNLSNSSAMTVRAASAHQISNVHFDHCAMAVGDYGIMYVKGEEPNIRSITIEGVTYDHYTNPTSDIGQVPQFPVDPATGIPGPGGFKALDIVYQRPHEK